MELMNERELESVKKLVQKKDCVWLFRFKGELYGDGLENVKTEDIPEAMEALGIQAKLAAKELLEESNTIPWEG